MFYYDLVIFWHFVCLRVQVLHFTVLLCVMMCLDEDPNAAGKRQSEDVEISFRKMPTYKTY